MSVTQELSLFFRGYTGFADPSLPGGMWASQGSVLGDASGGVRIAQVVFQPSTSLRSSLFFSLERLYVFDIDNNAKVGDVSTNNFALAPNVGGLVALNGNLVAGASGAVLSSEAQEAIDRGHLLGVQNTPNTELALNYFTTNVDGIILAVVFQGYFWTARSILAPGGPSRPPQGLY